MQNPRMAASLGIHPPTVFMSTFALGAGLAGFAGGLLSDFRRFTLHGSGLCRAGLHHCAGGGPAVIMGTGLASGLFGLINEIVSFLSTPVLGEVALLVAAIVLIRNLPNGITGRFFRSSL